MRTKKEEKAVKAQIAAVIKEIKAQLKAKKLPLKVAAEYLGKAWNTCYTYFARGQFPCTGEFLQSLQALKKHVASGEPEKQRHTVHQETTQLTKTLKQLKAKDKGLTFRTLAEKAGISYSTIYNFIQRPKDAPRRVLPNLKAIVEHIQEGKEIRPLDGKVLVQSLKKVCKRKGWSMETVAQLTGTSYSTIFRIFHKQNVPSGGTKKKLEEFLQSKIAG
jgi:predicted DNA-binding transcriptional regulator AlpA